MPPRSLEACFAHDRLIAIVRRVVIGHYDLVRRRVAPRSDSGPNKQWVSLLLALDGLHPLLQQLEPDRTPHTDDRGTV